MIAQPRFAEPPRTVERVRRATKRRVRRSRVRIHRPVFAVLALAVAVFLPLLAYVKLTSDTVSLSYSLADTELKRTKLVEESQRLDDKIASLSSWERLEPLAARLKMHDPQVYAVVTLPAPKAQAKPSGIAFFGWTLNAARP